MQGRWSSSQVRTDGKKVRNADAENTRGGELRLQYGAVRCARTRAGSVKVPPQVRSPAGQVMV
jgi:hypothetical protein